MGGWCPSSVCGWVGGVHSPRCVEWRWCVLLPSCPVQWCGSCPTHPHCSAGEYCCHVVYCSLPGVWVVGMWCVLFVWWGILCPLPPRRGGGWGHRGWWGAVVDGGVAWWRKGGCVAGLPVLCVVSPLCLCGGPVEWREWCVLCCPLVSCCPRPLRGVPCL